MPVLGHVVLGVVDQTHLSTFQMNYGMCPSFPHGPHAVCPPMHATAVTGRAIHCLGHKCYPLV